jgi:Immunity protein Imm5
VYDRRAVDEAQAHIRDIDIAGELPLTARRQLKESLAALLPDGHRALTFIGVLGLTCAKQAWPVWQTAFPSESQPMDLAQAAVSGIAKEATSGSPLVRSEFANVKTYLDNKFLLGQKYFSGIYAGFAAWAVARNILFWDHAKAVRGNTDLDISPEDWDPCFFASLAVTGGAIWENIGKSDTRREFWYWYLTTAVPEAFTVAVEL